MVGSGLGQPGLKETVVSAFGDFLWATSARKALTSIALVASTITAVATAAPTAEPWIAAHRGYVREIVDALEKKFRIAEDKGYATIRDLQIEQAEGKRDQAAELIFKWQVELGKAPDDQAKALISDRLRDLERTKRRLDAQIETLTKARGH